MSVGFWIIKPDQEGKNYLDSLRLQLESKKQELANTKGTLEVTEKELRRKEIENMNLKDNKNIYIRELVINLCKKKINNFTTNTVKTITQELEEVLEKEDSFKKKEQKLQKYLANNCDPVENSN